MKYESDEELTVSEHDGKPERYSKSKPVKQLSFEKKVSALKAVLEQKMVDDAYDSFYHEILNPVLKDKKLEKLEEIAESKPLHAFIKSLMWELKRRASNLDRIIALKRSLDELQKAGSSNRITIIDTEIVRVYLLCVLNTCHKFAPLTEIANECYEKTQLKKLSIPTLITFMKMLFKTQDEAKITKCFETIEEKSQTSKEKEMGHYTLMVRFCLKHLANLDRAKHYLNKAKELCPGPDEAPFDCFAELLHHATVRKMEPLLKELLEDLQNKFSKQKLIEKLGKPYKKALGLEVSFKRKEKKGDKIAARQVRKQLKKVAQEKAKEKKASKKRTRGTEENEEEEVDEREEGDENEEEEEVEESEEEENVKSDEDEDNDIEEEEEEDEQPQAKKQKVDNSTSSKKKKQKHKKKAKEVKANKPKRNKDKYNKNKQKKVK